ncbi:calmodulin [Cystoisospora suis]|uniref:Calmodulin n=1 Tax=Cystoisospora suis TaxID=483139 RepID=A0A2C6L4T8_9APIC|nr:calmodulin [Cystoisospora suis]
MAGSSGNELRRDMKPFMEAFGLFDSNGDGFLTPEQAVMAARSCGLSVEKDSACSLGQQISRSAYGDWIARELAAAPLDPRKHLITSFQALDRANTGKVSAPELKEILKASGGILTETEVDALVSEADKDGNGCIDYVRFTDELLS